MSHQVDFPLAILVPQVDAQNEEGTIDIANIYLFTSVWVKDHELYTWRRRDRPTILYKSHVSLYHGDGALCTYLVPEPTHSGANRLLSDFQSVSSWFDVLRNCVHLYSVVNMSACPRFVRGPVPDI
jgi:hypothetical protein